MFIIRAVISAAQPQPDGVEAARSLDQAEYFSDHRLQVAGAAVEHSQNGRHQGLIRFGLLALGDVEVNPEPAVRLSVDVQGDKIPQARPPALHGEFFALDRLSALKDFPDAGDGLVRMQDKRS